MSSKNVILLTIGILIIITVFFALGYKKNRENEALENYIFKIAVAINTKKFKDNVVKNLVIPSGKVKENINIDNNNSKPNIPNVNKELSIPVLAYHNFMKSEDKWKYAPNDKYVMELEKFEEQLREQFSVDKLFANPSATVVSSLEDLEEKEDFSKPKSITKYVVQEENTEIEENVEQKGEEINTKENNSETMNKEEQSKVEQNAFPQKVEKKCGFLQKLKNFFFKQKSNN